MQDSVTKFYDELSVDYHFIFENWDESIERQSLIFNRLISRNLTQTNGQTILLDCSCGIGTQAIGLAKLGYKVTATDLSSSSIQRAKREAESRGVKITFGVADFRSLKTKVHGEFDVVLSADNAISHLLTDEDLHLACENLYLKVRQDGLLIITIRDYDAIFQNQPKVTTPNVLNNGKRITFQVWNWTSDYRTYNLNQFIVQEVDGQWVTKCFSTIYRALLRQEIDSVLISCGFKDVKWHMPEETGFYQPVVTARK